MAKSGFVPQSDTVPHCASLHAGYGATVL